MKKISLLASICMFTLLMGGCAGNVESAPAEDSSEAVSENPEIQNDMPEPAEQEVELINKETDDDEHVTDVPVVPNYYSSVSDVDETVIYLGGAGGIYRINPESEAQTIYAAPHIAGAALYKDYIFSIEYNVSDNGMTAELIRMNQDGSDKKVMTQISSESYDLRIIDNVLVITEQTIGDYGLETLFYSYTLDDEGNLASDTPQDAYARFGLPDGYEDGMHFLIDPWFSTKYFGYSCFMKAVGETGMNSVWIKTENEGLAEEVVTCSGNPLAAKDMIFYCDSNGETLMQRSLDSAQETVLYEIPDDAGLSLLTYDSEWVYFLYYLKRPRTESGAEFYSAIKRVNLQDLGTEEIYELQEGSYISNFNVYGNDCYFILSSAGAVQWKRYNLIAGNDIENLENVQTASEVAAPTGEEVLAMREHVLEGMSAEEIERLTENIKTANLRMEYAYLYDNIFTKLSDKESLYWNYFDQKRKF